MRQSEPLVDKRERRRVEGELPLQRRGVDDDGVVVEERAEPMGPAMEAERSDGGAEAAEEGNGTSASRGRASRSWTSESDDGPKASCRCCSNCEPWWMTPEASEILSICGWEAGSRGGNG